MVVAVALEVLGPIWSKILIDDYIVPRNQNWPAIAVIIVASFVTAILGAWIGWRQRLRFAGIALRAVAGLRQRVFEHVIRLPVAWFDSAISGKLVSRVTNDTESVQDLYLHFLYTLLHNGIVLIGILTAMAVLDWQMMLVALAIVPVIVVIVLLYQRISGHHVARSREVRAEINAQFSESIQGMPILQASGQVGRFQQSFDATNDRFYVTRMRTLRAQAMLLRPAMDLIGGLLLAGIILAFGITGGIGGKDVGVLFAFLAYLGRFIEPLIEISQQFNSLQAAQVAAARVNTLLKQPAETMPDTAPPITSGAVRFTDLHFAYQPDKPALQGINLDIAHGEFVGIVGPTGSGKSTLLNLLLGFYAPQEGSVTIDGQPVRECAVDDFRQQVALVPQEPFILADTVEANIDLGRGLSAAERKRAATLSRFDE
ncbi:unnamed protein product, partial [Cyprideis torosa]